MLPRTMTYALLLVALVIILISAEGFTNAVEWFGRRFELGEGAVGSVLAAVGTALPETLVPIIAILFSGKAAGDEIGIGAILGAPFMLSSLAMFVTGAAVYYFAWRGRRPREVTINETVMRRDLLYFLIAYSVAMIAGLIPVMHVKWVIAPCLLVAYAFYVYRTMQSEGDLGGELKPLYFHRHPVMPHRRRIILQLIVSTAGIVLGAKIFVDQVNTVSLSLGADPLIVSLLLSPIATELPEKFNSVIWVRQRKDTLALGNITGAMVFQSTFPVSIGLIFTQWDLTRTGLVSGALALISGTVFYLTLRFRHTLTWWSLGGAVTMYMAYLVYVVAFVGR
jgi:cation:H+ antiporter